MIGTRHEKAVIVLTSYVIGFTTAFIAFGLNAMYNNADTLNNSYQAASKISSTADYKKIHNNISAIGTDESGLYVTIGGYNRIISGNKNALGASVIESVKGPGYAVEHHFATVTEDGWFAFYCEQTEEDMTTCDPYVYSLFDDTIHKVTLDGYHETLDISDVVVTWSETNQLIINSFTSKDQSKPWIFTYADSSEPIVDEVVETEVTPVAEEPVASEETSTPEVAEEAVPELTDLEVQ